MYRNIPHIFIVKFLLKKSAKSEDKILNLNPNLNANHQFGRLRIPEVI